MANGPGVDTLTSLLSDWAETGEVQSAVVCVQWKNGTTSVMTAFDPENEDETMRLMRAGTRVVERLIGAEAETLQ